MAGMASDRTVAPDVAPPSTDSGPVQNAATVSAAPAADDGDLYAVSEKEEGVGPDLEVGEDFESELFAQSGMFEPFATINSSIEFGSTIDELHDRLERHRLVFLHSTDGPRLTEFSRSLISQHFRSHQYLSCYTKPKPGKRSPVSIDGIVRGVMNSDAKTLIVVFDQHRGSDSLLQTHAYQGDRGAALLKAIRDRGSLRILVLTTPSRFSALVTDFDAHDLAQVGYPLESPTSGSSAPTFDTDVIDVVFADHGQAGVMSAWCLAWFNDAPADGLITLIEGMLSHAHEKAKVRRQILGRWRTEWPKLLTALRVTAVEDPTVGVKLELPSETSVTELQRLLRVAHRMRHVEAMTLLRSSDALLTADSDILIAFAWMMTRLAVAEPQLGADVLRHLADEWFHAAPRERTLLVVLTTFVRLVRTSAVELARKALVTLRRAGHVDLVRDVLLRCPPDYISQQWHLELYDDLLPQLPQRSRLRLWSRFVRIAAVSRDTLKDVIVKLNAHASAPLFAEFVGRYAEEALIGSRKRSGRLLDLLRSPGGDASGCLIDMLTSDRFRKYSEQRSDRWARQGRAHPLFDMWIVKTLEPIVPSMSLPRLLALFGEALYDELPAHVPRMYRQSSPADEIVALLLIECCSASADSDAPLPSDQVVELVRRLIPDKQTATAVYETLRLASDRFLRACRISALIPGGHDALDLDSSGAIRRFFTAKSTIVRSLRQIIQRLYFTGADRANSPTE